MGRQYNLQASWVGITIYNAFNNNIACIKLASNPITPAPCLPSSSKISRGAFITGVISPIVLLHQLSAATALKQTSVIIICHGVIGRSIIGRSTIGQCYNSKRHHKNFTRINLTLDPTTCGSFSSHIIDQIIHLRQGSLHV